MSENKPDSVSGVVEEIHILAMEQAREEDNKAYEDRELALQALKKKLVTLRRDM